MEKMQELYQKVAGDANLQEKFSEIMGNAEKLGAEETEKKLLVFAKEAEYDISIEEMQRFFLGLSEKKQDELSDSELDMVAGGKLSSGDWGAIFGGTLLAVSTVAGFTGAGIPVAVGCIAGAGVIEGATS